MASNGILSITQHGEVLLKIITGNNGDLIPLLKAWIETHTGASVADIYRKCLAFFGADKLVIQYSQDGAYFNDALMGKLSIYYKQEFYNPTFNPQCDSGKADYVEVIEIY